ncbi:MAG: ankyrin repeat domain-containing protein [Gammaproteobacteria bacterium]|nr:ankyrin repeat domain-containing protein [Gammaproteobacteria bacterium]MCW5582395.1 ankyrin repeat domain-containing protein [Gammaproteobacteria bacterium]
MFSFFNSSHKVPVSAKVIGANELVDKLEDELPLENQWLIFNKDHCTRHHNTYLLQALAWNRQKAALKLLELDKNKEALNLKDDWPTCLNSPLILAAKINAGYIVQKLITLGANLNEQDYRGFTALHYACILRNDAVIKSLLAAKANLQMIDAFGKSPYDYYDMEICETDLQYRYGKAGEYLNHIPDRDNHYFATKKKCLSALRWYIAHIMVNGGWGTESDVDKVSLYDYAKHCLKIREPVYHAEVYEGMMRCFCNNRPSKDKALMHQLSMTFNSYKDEKCDQYQLNLWDLTPRSAIHQQENDEIWIELQELHPIAYRKH